MLAVLRCGVLSSTHDGQTMNRDINDSGRGRARLRSVDRRESLDSWSELRERVDRLNRPRAISIDFVRHGESVANAMGLVTGSWDVALSERGREQAWALGLELKSHYDLAWSSPLKRSRDTLHLALRASGNASVNCLADSRLGERCLGVLEGKPRGFIPQYAAGDLGFAPERGESYLEVTQRVLSFLLDVLDPAVTPVTVERVLISTHAGPLRIIYAALEGISDRCQVLRSDFANARLYRMTINRIGWPAFLPNSRTTHHATDRDRLVPAIVSTRH